MPHLHIEKGVKLEEHMRTRGVSKNQDIIDALHACEVDDSFTIPYNRKASYESVKSMLQKTGHDHGKKWASRKEDNVTLRIWRIL